MLYLAPELAAQEVAVRLACPFATTRVELLVDGESVATASGCPGQLAVPLEPGIHTLLARASIPGEVMEASIRFEVRR